MEDGEIITAPLYVFEEDGEDYRGKIIGKLKKTEHSLQSINKLKLAGKNDVVEQFTKA